VTLVSEIIARILWKHEKNTFPIFHIYALLEFSFLSIIYGELFGARQIKRLLYLGIPLLWLFGILNLVFWQDLQSPNTNVTTTTSILLILISVFYFFWILSKMKIKKLESSSGFWINIAVFAYFCSSLMLFVFGDWLAAFSVEYTINVWVIHVFFNTVHYFCFNLALWMDQE